MTKNIDLILSLNDQELEDVMAAVHTWCSCHDVALDTDLGRQALMIAARARLTTEASASRLQNVISDELTGWQLNDSYRAGRTS
jgi:hypothetical protein